MPQTYPSNRVLIIGSDPVLRGIIVAALNPGRSANAGKKGKEIAAWPRSKGAGNARFKVTCVDTVEAGIQMVRTAVGTKGPFAIALIDLKSAGVDGIESSLRIRLADPRLKMVVLADASSPVPEKAFHLMNGRKNLFCLRGPVDPGEVCQLALLFAHQWSLERGREQMAKALEEANRNLEEKVAARTAMLVQSEKMASIGMLAAGIAHEINNPISYVNGNLEAVKKYCLRIKELLEHYRMLEKSAAGSGDPELMEMLGRIEAFKQEYKMDFILEDIVELADDSLEGSVRVGDIIRNLRNFSRTDEDVLEHAAVNDIMDLAVNIIWNDLKYKAEIARDYAPLPSIECYPRRLCQVFMNLLLNAVQALDQSGTIAIKTRYREPGPDSGGYVEIRVEDNGVGIPEAHLSRVFEPFFTTKRSPVNTGLGLSISYDIIEEQGGKLYASSRPGEGSVFTVILPVEEDSD